MLMSVVQIHLSPPNAKSLLALPAGIFFAAVPAFSICQYHARGDQFLTHYLHHHLTI
jgi:hypothetical protein